MTETAVRTVADPQPRQQVMGEVADNVTELMRSFTRARARLLAAARHDVEWSAHVILKTLENEGPLRSGTLAEFIHSDPSTVSRQVAGLVKDGLLERQADPEDGRAALLVLTARAHEVLREHRDVRLDYFAKMLDDWSSPDLEQLAAVLRRFATTYDNAYENWMSERIGRGARSGGRA